MTERDRLRLLCNSVRTHCREFEVLAMQIIVALLPNFSMLHCCLTSVCCVHCLQSSLMKAVRLDENLAYIIYKALNFIIALLPNFSHCTWGYLLSDCAVLHNNSTPTSIYYSTLLPKFTLLSDCLVSSCFMIYVLSLSHSCSSLQHFALKMWRTVAKIQTVL